MMAGSVRMGLDAAVALLLATVLLGVYLVDRRVALFLGAAQILVQHGEHVVEAPVHFHEPLIHELGRRRDQDAPSMKPTSARLPRLTSYLACAWPR